MHLIAGGDLRALKEIVRRHLSSVFRAAAAASGDRYEAAVVTRGIFLRVWRERELSAAHDGRLGHQLGLSAHRDARKRTTVRRRFEELSEREQDVIALARDVRLSVSEIASVLDVPAQVVKDRMRSALAHLA